MSSLPPSHFAFLVLPPELKCRILNDIGHRSLLRVSMTSKEMYNFVYSSKDMVFRIELARSQLVSTSPVQSVVMAQQLIDAHRESRLTLPVASRPFIRFASPTVGARIERLFHGLFACVSRDLELHVWDLRKLDAQSPKPFLTISQQNVQDVVIDRELDLLVLLCFENGSDIVVIKFLELSSLGTRPHPRVVKPITHATPLDEFVTVETSREVMFLRSNLIALVYYPHLNYGTRRGMIWDWTTGNLVYDSEKASDPRGFRHLLLFPWPGCFVISTLTPEGLPPCRSGCMELRVAVTASHVPRGNPPTSELVGIFHLPQLSVTKNGSAQILDFFSSVPLNGGRNSTPNGNSFPFDSNPETSVHLLLLSYEGSVRRISSDGGYLVISNQVYVDTLRQWSSWKGRMQRSENDQTFPLNLDWFAWAPWWTSMWDYKEPDLSMTSSVCGSRICSSKWVGENLIGIEVLDFNMNFPCNTRECTKPLAHFYPRSVDLADWKDKIYTWLPFHLDLRLIEFPSYQEVSPVVLMDEERIILCDMVHSEKGKWSWTVVYLIQESQGARDQLDPTNYLKAAHDPRGEHQPFTFRSERTCRLCAKGPHTDIHILLECKANSVVVKLRQTLLIDSLECNEPDLYRLWCSELYEELFKEMMDRQDSVQMPISLLALDILTIYKDLPQCDSASSAPLDNPSYMFAVDR